MHQENKRLLIMYSAMLYATGLRVEKERNNLRKLVKKNVPFNSKEMAQTYLAFKTAETEWNRLEQLCLLLRGNDYSQ